MNLPRTTYLVILVSAFAWCTAIVTAPYLAAAASPLSVSVYQIFRPICHQLPERSFFFFGEKLAVCSRCSSVYFAFLAGTFVFPFLHRRISPLFHNSVRTRFVLFAVLLPMLLDVVGEFAGIHDSTFLTRTITGALLGLVLPFVILPAAIEGVQQLVVQRSAVSTIIDN
ncbi:MAG: DUF2085 domain-containing protein [Bacteroidetes bacterium]|nr:DUF2085 domain-containing protein [Bacteroidota bacterium]MCW5894896.1 DUF2085 domain-containing protein [Bacteroidota bacterium]